MKKRVCDFKTSEASTKAWFRTKGIIDKFLNILDLNEFRKQNTKWSNYARRKYKTEGRLFVEENNGKKALPNKEVFKKIDNSKGIFYSLPEEQVNYSLKAINILQSDKAKQIFAKGQKNGWDLNKILTELQVPKEQKQIILDKDLNNKIAGKKISIVAKRRKLASEWDLKNSQLIKDIRVDKSQPNELKPNAADNNLAAIMLYGMKMSDLQDKGLPEEMNEANVLAYRILNDFMFNINELDFYKDILLDNPEYAQTLTTNENPVKEFFENDLFEESDKVKINLREEIITSLLAENSEVRKIQYQKNQTVSTEGQIASEKTIRDLAARMSDRIGIPIKFESDRTLNYKGKIENGTAVINLSHATLDTPIHEILGHPIIRAIKGDARLRLGDSVYYRDILHNKQKAIITEIRDSGNYITIKTESGLTYDLGGYEVDKIQNNLYDNLLKELETGKGKEVLDRIKRDYKYKDIDIINNLIGSNIFKDKIQQLNKEIESLPTLPKQEEFNISKSTTLKSTFDIKYKDKNLGTVKQEGGYFYWTRPSKAVVKIGKSSNVNDAFRKVIYKTIKKEFDLKYDISKLNNSIKKYSGDITVVKGVGNTNKGLYYLTNEFADDLGNYSLEELKTIIGEENFPKYTLEEQQEEAIVELLGLMTAEKLDNVKDGKLISLLKRLLKEMKAFVRSLINQKEVEIDKLPDNMTLGDIADLLAYSNSKLILPGYEVEYTTPDNQKFKTYQEASNYISKLAKSVEDVDLDTIKINTEKIKSYWIRSGEDGDIMESGLTLEEATKKLDRYNKNLSKYTPLFFIEESKFDNKSANPILNFTEKNKKYEQSKEIIEEWKKVNNIQYNPEEIYSRGQEFASVVGAYSSFDVNLMMQNLLSHIEDNEKAGGKFAVSAFTKPIDKKIGHLEGGGGKIKFKIYPQSKDILWAANTDVYSGSVWDASEKVNKDKKSELLGVSYTKYPSLNNINAVQPNLASIVDDLAHHHNELGITLTGNNFRLEYDEDIPYQTKKIINSINKILNQKYGKLVKPEIKIKENNTIYTANGEFDQSTGNSIIKEFTTKKEAEKWIEENKEEYNRQTGDNLILEKYINKGIQPTQTKENLKESIDSVKSKLGITKSNAARKKFLRDEINSLKTATIKKSNQDKNPYKEYDRVVIEEEYFMYEKNEEFFVQDMSYQYNEPEPITKELFEQKIKEFGDSKEIKIEDDYYLEVPDTIYFSDRFDTKEDAQNYIKNTLDKYNKELKILNQEKEYTSQALINTKIARLKEVAKKYPRSLIRSEVVLSDKTAGENRYQGFEGDELPFQKINHELSQEKASAPILLQKEKPQKTKVENEKELWSLLKRTAGNLGISVEAYDSLKSKYGVDAVGAADITNKLIALSNGKNADVTTLAEELSHFITVGLQDKQTVKRLQEIIHEHPVYEEVVNEYGEIYKGDETKLRKEAVDKLLAEGIIRGNNERIRQSSPAIVKLLKAVWNNIKRLFKKVSGDRVGEINSLIGKISDKVLREDIQDVNTENFNNNNIYYQTEDLSGYEKVLSKAIKLINSQIVIYNAKGRKAFAKKEEDQLRELIQASEEDYAKLGIIKYIKETRKKILLINGDLTSNDLDLQKGRLKTIEEKFDSGELSPQQTAERIRTFKQFSKSHAPILKDIQAELQKDLPLSVRDRKILTVISNTLSSISSIENSYYDIGKKVFASMLTSYSSKLQEDDIKKLLVKMDKDITWTQRHLDALAEADNSILNIIDRLVKDFKEEAREKALDIRKDILNAYDRLIESGITDTSWFYERHDGKYTGNIIQEYNYGYWESERNELEKRISGLSDKNKKRERAKWYKKNTQPHPEAKKIAQQRKEELSDEQYSEWLDSVIHETDSGKKIFKGELSVPSDNYINKSYINLSVAQKEFYETIMGIKKEMDNLLPQKLIDRNLAPQLRKDGLERLTSKNVFKNTLEGVKDLLQKKEDETEFGSIYGVTDEEGNPINLLPIYFTKKLNDVNDNLSTDIVTAMSAYSAMALDYTSMDKIVDVLELGKDVIGETDITITKGGKPLIKKMGGIFGNKTETQTVKGRDTKVYERLSDYYSMQIYGNLKKDEGTFKLFGTELDKAKIADALGKYTAINSLAFNVFSGIGNVVLGETLLHQEAAAKQFITAKSLAKGSKIYSSELPKFLSEIGTLNPKSKLALWGEYMDVLQDFKQETRGLDANRNRLSRGLFSSSALFFLNHAGEHEMQFRLSLALADEAKVKDKNGNIISLFDALEKKDNKLVIKDGVKKVSGRMWKESEEGQSLTQEDIRRFILKQHGINQRLHGIYNDNDKSAMQQYALGRLAIMFRKFMKPGWNRRFEKLRYSEQLETDVEGMYNTTAKFMKSLYLDLKQGQFSYSKNWSNLQEHEKANVRRTIVELGYALAAFTLAHVLTNLSDDDDENWALNMAAYQAHRLFTETTFYWNTKEAIRIFQSPAAAVNQVEHIMRFLEVHNWGEELSSGKYKGYSKFRRTAIEVIPFYSTVDDWATPEEKLKFFSK